MFKGKINERKPNGAGILATRIETSVNLRRVNNLELTWYSMSNHLLACLVIVGNR